MTSGAPRASRAIWTQSYPHWFKKAIRTGAHLGARLLRLNRFVSVEQKFQTFNIMAWFSVQKNMSVFILL